MQIGYLGIDPGKKGALVLLSEDDTILSKSIVPLDSSGEIALRKLATYLKLLKSEYIIQMTTLEHVQTLPHDGRVGAFDFGRTFGILETMLIMLELPYILVRPQKWMARMHAGLSREHATKKRSLMVAKKIFPFESFLATSRSRNPHDGLVDAALLSKYGKLISA